MGGAWLPADFRLIAFGMKAWDASIGENLKDWRAWVVEEL
jgi:hypothetical protein